MEEERVDKIMGNNYYKITVRVKENYELGLKNALKLRNMVEEYRFPINFKTEEKFIDTRNLSELIDILKNQQITITVSKKNKDYEDIADKFKEFFESPKCS